MQEWTAWGERVGDRLVDMGSLLENDGDADVQVSGYSVIDADSKEQLDGFLEGHPHTVAGRRARLTSRPCGSTGSCQPVNWAGSLRRATASFWAKCSTVRTTPQLGGDAVV
jgi:hypothetical protein